MKKLILSIRKNSLFLVLLLMIFAFYYKLGEYNQPTANLWIERSYKFFFLAKTKHFLETYLFYHPGVTLMWLVGPIVYYFPKYTNFIYNQTIDPHNAKVFFEFNKLALIPIVTTISSLTLISYLFIKKLFSKNIAILFLIFLISEPFFIGNSRSIHVDTLQTMFIFTSFLATLNYLKKEGRLYLLVASVLLGFALLTKITTVIYLPFLAILLLTKYFSKKDLIKATFKTSKVFLTMLVVSVITFILFWPVMWSKPINTIKTIYQDGIAESGFEHNLGYDYLYFGNIPNDSIITKILHYPLQFAYRTNGFTLLIGILLLIFLLKEKKSILKVNNKLLIVSVLFPLYYLALMSMSGKMIFRYLLIIYPFFHLFLAIGVSKLLQTKYKKLIILIIFLAITDAFTSYPNSLTYYNTLLGGINGSKFVVYTDQAGAGLYNIANDLNKIKDIQDKSVAVYDNNSFSDFFSGDTLKLKNHNYTDNVVNTDFVIIGVQNDYKYFNQKRQDYKLIKEYKYKNQTHWWLYKKVGD